MSADIKLEKFQGPLDLLLQLVEQEEMKITEISLSEATEQFVKYLDQLSENNSEELADFLVVATKLVYLKSRVLLPYLYPEEDEGPSLADQLKMYQQYVEASKKIEELWNNGQLSYGRIEPPVKAKDFVLPANAQTSDLHTTMLKLISRLKPIDPLPRVSIDRGITVRDKIDKILFILKQFKKISFSQILSNTGNKTEIIVSFLAVLDLLKAAKAVAYQKDSFSDLEIKLL
jgi:segregation and condensation protein A